MRRTPWPGVIAVAALAALAGCTASATSAGAPSSASALPSASTPSASALSSASTPAGSPRPPALFTAASITFVSADEAFALGTTSCPAAPCAAIEHTLNRGATWQPLPAPAARVSEPGGGGLWGIRYATPSHGFVFGDRLWETTDGGEHWASTAYPGGSVLALAIIDGQVLALTGACTTQSGCGASGTLLRRPLAGGAWTTVAAVTAVSWYPVLTGLIATQANVAAVVEGGSVLVTSDGGLTIARHQTPCAYPGIAVPTSVAVIAPSGLALLCDGQAYTGHTVKSVYLSDDLGATWTKAGAPSPAGDAGVIVAANKNQLLIATASAASWLYYSADGGRHWRTVLSYLDGGAGWSDLGFTTAADGVVIHGQPIPGSGNGQLLFTGDGGLTWHQVRI